MMHLNNNTVSMIKMSNAPVAKVTKRAEDLTLKATSFPSLVHRCLTDIDELARNDKDMKGLQKVFSWQSDGLSFKVHNRTKFMQLIMPVWFPRIKHTSFVRQLALFGFKKCEGNGERRGGMYHELFRRGEPELAQHIEKVGKKKQRPFGFLPVPLTSSQPSNTTRTSLAVAPEIEPISRYYSADGAVRLAQNVGAEAKMQEETKAPTSLSAFPQVARRPSANMMAQWHDDQHVPQQESWLRDFDTAQTTTRSSSFPSFFPIASAPASLLDDSESTNALLNADFASPSKQHDNRKVAAAAQQHESITSESKQADGNSSRNPFLDLVLQNMERHSNRDESTLEQDYQPTFEDLAAILDEDDF